MVGRRNGESAGWCQALSIVVHATVVLLIGRVIVTPLHYVRESLTSPLNLAAALPAMDDGTVAAHLRVARYLRPVVVRAAGDRPGDPDSDGTSAVTHSPWQGFTWGLPQS